MREGVASAREVAIYLMQNEPLLLSEEILTRNGHSMYEGNFRLNKYLHIAENVYIAKTGELLFQDALYAYDNGGVVLDVFQSFLPLKRALGNSVDLPEEKKEFLLRIIRSLKNADNDDLLDISHQDREWKQRNRSDNQRMDSLSRAEEYREQYKDILKMMELGLC